MIRNICQGHLLDSDAHTLVNTVNTVGVMGKGIALEFRKRFPDMYDDYLQRCAAKQVQLGKPYLFQRLIPPWIINFPTKEHWRSVSRLDAIVEGLVFLAAHVEDWGVESLAVPPLGCGNGQLEWAVVGPTLFRHLDALPMPVDLYAPLDAPSVQLSREFLVDPSDVPASGAARIPAGWVALATIVDRVQGSRYAWPVGHTRWQKLAYFATASGIPTEVGFEERQYGPFSSDLRGVLARLVNNGILKEEARGRMIGILPGPAFHDAVERFRDDLMAMESRIARTVDLLLRLDPERAEIAASAHFVAQSLARPDDQLPSESEVIERILRWKRRRREPLSPTEVAITIRELEGLDWLAVVIADEPVEEPADAALYA
jgi:O-acetyl-ADP-ribose deacetylase (regulator of RNase III)